MIKKLLNSEKEYNDLITSLTEEYDSKTISTNHEYHTPTRFPCIFVYTFDVTDYGYDIFETERIYLSDFLDS